MVFVQKKVVLVLLLSISIGIAKAQTTYYSLANGNWNDPNTWSTESHIGAAASTVPGNSTDIVIIAAGHVIDYNANHPTDDISVASLTLGTSDGAGTLRFPFSDHDPVGEINDLNANFSLTVEGDVVINSNGQMTHEEGGAGSPMMAGNAQDRTHSLIVQGNVTNTGTLDLERSAGNRMINLHFTGSANQTVFGEGTYDTYAVTYQNTGTAPNNQMINQSAGFTASVAAGLSTFTQGTYVHDNAGTYINQGVANAGTDYTNMSFQVLNGTFTMTETVASEETVILTNGNLTVSGGIFNSGSGGVGSGVAVHIVVGGNLTVSGSGQLNIGDGNPVGPVLPTSGTLTVQGGASSLNQGTIYTDSLSIESGAVLAVSNGATLSVGKASIGGTFNYNNTGGSGNFYESLYILATGSMTMNTGTVIHVIPSLTTVSDTHVTLHGALTMNGGTFHLGAGVTSVTAGNLLEIGDGGSLNINAGSFNILANSGLSSISNNNIVYISNNDAGEDATPGDGAIMVGDGSGMGSTAALSVAPNLAVQAPAQSRDVINVGGANGLLTVRSDGYLNIGGGNTGNLALSASGARFTLNGGTCEITAALSLSSGTTATVSSGTLTIDALGSGNRGILYEDDPVAATRFVLSSGIVNIGSGNGLLILGDGDALPAFGDAGYQSLEITGGTFNLNGGLQLNDANARFIMSTGALNLNPRGSQNLAATQHIIGLERGTVNFSGGQITLINPHADAGSGYALQINEPGDPGTFSNQISVTSMVGSFRFGNGTASMAGSTEGYDVYVEDGPVFGGFVVNNPSGTNRYVVLAHSGQNYVANSLIVTAGTLDLNTNTVNPQSSAPSSFLTLSAQSRLLIGNSDNTDHFPGSSTAFKIYSIHQTSTVEYDGAGNAQVNLSGPGGQFGNLIISGTGTKTLSASETVRTVLTLSGSTFVTSTRLTMGSGSTISRTGSDTEGIMTGTIQGSNAYTINYTGVSKTTQAGEWSGAGRKSCNVNLTLGETLTAHAALSIGGNLNLNTGILADGGFVLTVNGNLYNASTHTGSGRILLTGGTALHTIGGNGNGVFQNIELNDALGAGFSATQSINGTLTLTAGVFDINTYLLSLGSSAVVTVTAPDNTKMIEMTAGTGSAGMEKLFGGVGSFTWPVGSNGKYTPATIDVISTGSEGSITMNLVDTEHPSTLDENDVALDYYWHVNSTGFSAIQATHTYFYDTTDQSGRGNELAYIPARYYLDSWNIIDTVTRVDESTHSIIFTNVGYLDGDFTAGESSEFGSVIIYYSRTASGSWNDPNSWSTIAVGGDPASTPPGSNTSIVVGAGNTITIDANNIVTTGVEIRADGTLEISDNTLNHQLGTVIGEGTLRIITNDATATAFPNGTFTGFLGTSGGTVEYAGSGTYTMITSTPLYFHHITFSGSGTVTLPASNTNISGNMTLLDNVTVQANTSSNGDVVIAGDFNVSSTGATFQFQTGTARQIEIGGDINNDGTIQLSGEGSTVHSIVIEGDIINTNVFDLASSFSDHRADVAVTGSVIQTIQGNAEMGSLIINGTGLTLAGDVNIAQDFTLVSGTFSPATYTVDFIRNTAQLLTGNTNFHHLTKSGGGSLTLNDSITLAGNLSLTNGILYTSETAFLTLDVDAAVVGGSNSSYIQGPMAHRATIDGSALTKVFPLGSNNLYRGVTLDLNPSDIIAGGVATYRGELLTGAPPARTLPDSIDHVSSIRYYTIDQEATGLDFNPNAVVTIQYNTDDGVDTPADLRIVKSNDLGEWLDIGGTGSGATSGQITSIPFSAFSDFALGSSSVNNPLPIQLLAFRAEVVEGEGVSLFWQTGSEEGNDYFILERSVDGRIFEEIGQIKGAGYSVDIVNYTFMDTYPLQGQNFYRLKQVDFNGAFEYSKTIAIQYSQGLALRWIIFPNPAANGKAEIHIQGLDQEEWVEVQLYSGQGLQLQASKVRADIWGKAVVSFSNLSALPKGMYPVIIIHKSGYFSDKLLVQ